jgi:hypothetical protein
MCVAVLQFRREPARSRPDDGLSRRSGELRDHPSLVRYVRGFLCGQAKAETAQAGRQMVPGRSVLKGQWSAALPLARSRPTGYRHRHSGLTEARPFCRHSLFPQAVAYRRSGSPRDRHRQTAQLWGRQESRAAASCTLAKPISKQPGRELASAGPATRAPYEALQVSSACATLS